MIPMDRIRALCSDRPLDRPPFAAWGHVMNLQDRDAKAFAEATIRFQNANGFDLIKIMSNPYYMLEDSGIRLVPPQDPDTPLIRDGRQLLVPEAKSWGNLRFPRVGKGALLREREAIQRVTDYFGDTVPVIATIFTPIMWIAYAALPLDDIDQAIKQDGNYTALLERYLTENESYVLPAIENFSALNLAYMEDLLQAGVSGFFYCTEHMRTSWSSLDAFERFEKRYDLEVLQAVRKRSFFQLLHICGDANLCLEQALDYPVDALNWEDQSSYNPSLAEVRCVTDKILVGGLDRHLDMNGTPQEIRARLTQRIADAVAQAGKKLILSGGCDWSPAATRKFSIWREVMDAYGQEKYQQV